MALEIIKTETANIARRSYQKLNLFDDLWSAASIDIDNALLWQTTEPRLFYWPGKELQIGINP